jgi:type I restriction enzyme S subunit
MVVATKQKAIRPGYKQTEVGMIPDDWDVETFADVFSISAGGDFDPARSSDEHDDKHPHPVYSNALTNAGLYGYCSYSNHRGGSITVTARGTLGVANYRDRDFTAIGRVLVLEPRKRLAGRFFAEYINDRVQFAVESTGVPQLTAPQISKYKLPIPGLIEQTAIASALCDVDALIASLDKLVAKKRDVKTAAMQVLLTGKRRLPGFTGKWEVKKLGELLAYEQPSRYLVESAEYSDTYRTPVLTAGKTFILGYTSEETGIFQDLPIIIFDDFTTASKYVEFPFKAKSSAMKMLRPKNSAVNLKFVFEQMQLVDFALGDHKRYWISEYQNLDVEVPMPDEQSAIATVLSGMDGEIAALEARRDKSQALKQGMMQQLLTGRTRLI